jgi:selenide,water dikinase
LPPGDLVEILSQIPRSTSDDLIVGPETLDDAGVFRITPDIALVQTLDFFPPIHDDPLWFGRIAAANALSDVYAMGGVPLTVMNIVGFPKELPISILGEILKGGAEKVIEAGAVVVGGHSVQDAEIKYGLSVTGRVHPDRVVSNAAAKPGDLLVLTKPLGMGATSTAMKFEKLDARLAEAAAVQMATLNKGGAAAMLRCGVRSATDITGFGLAGHGRGMAQASGVTLEIVAAAVPLFEGALALAEQKMLSGGAKRTRAFLGAHAEVAASVPDALAGLMFDSETSGGLLIAIAKEREHELLEELKKEGTICAATIGRVVPRDGEVRVRFA